jgi:hypothetical protein
MNRISRMVANLLCCIGTETPQQTKKLAQKQALVTHSLEIVRPLTEKALAEKALGRVESEQG